MRTRGGGGRKGRYTIRPLPPLANSHLGRVSERTEPKLVVFVVNLDSFGVVVVPKKMTEPGNLVNLKRTRGLCLHFTKGDKFLIYFLVFFRQFPETRKFSDFRKPFPLRLLRPKRKVPWFSLQLSTLSSGNRYLHTRIVLTLLSSLSTRFVPRPSPTRTVWLSDRVVGRRTGSGWGETGGRGSEVDVSLYIIF